MRKNGMCALVVLAILVSGTAFLSYGASADGGMYKLFVPLIGNGVSALPPENVLLGSIPDLAGVPVYRQDDSAWKCEMLGSCSCSGTSRPPGVSCICGNEGMCPDKPGVTTIGSDGCALTSLAMVYGYYGGTSNPSQLNACFRERGIYNPNGNCGSCYWNPTDVRCAPSGITVLTNNNFDTDTALRAGFPIIARLSSRNHFVVIVGKESDGRYKVHDPQAGVVVMDGSALSSERYCYRGAPPYPENISPNGLEFFEIGRDIQIGWNGFFPNEEEYRVKIVGQAYLGIDGDPWVYFGPLTTFLETGWISEQSYTIRSGIVPEGLHRIYIASRWKENHLTKGYPASFGSNCFRVGSCDWPGLNASRSSVGIADTQVSSVHWCPADIATPTPTPRSTITRVVPTATNTPRPANTPTSTTIPFGIPRLVSPSGGSSFTSGDRIVLSWDCPGGCAESKCWIEREGEVYDSGWTRNLSWVSPINNYGDIKWKARSKKGDGEESDWTQEWTIHIQSTGSIPPRLIDPSKGTIFNYGSQVVLRWECRSYECKADLLKNGIYLGSSGWTQNEAGWRLYSNVGCGSFTWHVKGRDSQERETNWSPTFDFRIINCPPTATPRPTGTRTMTGTATRTGTPTMTGTATGTVTKTATATATKTGTVSASRTQTLSPTKTKTSVGTRTQTPTPTRTRLVIPTIPPWPTLTRIPTRTPRPTSTPWWLEP